MASDRTPPALGSPSHPSLALRHYLDLAPPRPVLDLRPRAHFARSHIQSSTHLFPPSALKQRYSLLPPRSVPFLVLAIPEQRDEVLALLEGCSAARLVLLSDASEHGGAYEPTTSSKKGEEQGEARVCEARSFWTGIERRGLLRSCAVSELDRRVHSQDDRPALLFRPSNAVLRLFQDEAFVFGDTEGLGGGNEGRDRRMLDLGCGAGRDLAWILYASPERSSRYRGADRKPPRWRGVGLDSWRAVLRRTEGVMRDLDLFPHHESSSAPAVANSSCEALIWARCTDDGAVEPLVGTGKGKALAFPPASEEQESAWRAFRDAGLEHLAPASPSTGLEERAASSSRERYDLILSVRFYPIALIRRVRSLVRPGGAVLVSHFTVVTDAERGRLLLQQQQREEEARGARAVLPLLIDYDSPGLQGRIGADDAADLTMQWNVEEGEAQTPYRWSVYRNVLEPIEDGRIVRSVVLLRSRAVPAQAAISSS